MRGTLWTLNALSWDALRYAPLSWVPLRSVGFRAFMRGAMLRPLIRNLCRVMIRQGNMRIAFVSAMWVLYIGLAIVGIVEPGAGAVIIALVSVLILTDRW